MKIYGIGTDIANINRIKRSLKNKDFIERLFNKNEVRKCNDGNLIRSIKATKF